MRAFTLIIVLLGVLSSGLAHAEWTLVTERSELSFVSTKNNSIAETNYFRQLDGKVSNTGEAILRISLAGVDTAIGIRDERMREFLFEVGKFSHAKLEGSVEQIPAVGERKTVDIPFALSLRGMSTSVTASLDVLRLSENTIMVNTRRPLLIQARDFGMLAGIERLREIAGLTTISPVVPVSASLVFIQQ